MDQIKMLENLNVENLGLESLGLENLVPKSLVLESLVPEGLVPYKCIIIIMLRTVTSLMPHKKLNINYNITFNV